MSDADTGPDSEKQKKYSEHVVGKTLRMCRMEQIFPEEEPRGYASVNLHQGP